MSNLPESKTKTGKRLRVMVDSGGWYASWFMVTDDGTLIIDPQGHGQYPKGTWRYFWECESKTTTYEEYAE